MLSYKTFISKIGDYIGEIHPKPIIAIDGYYGVGKTSLAKSIISFLNNQGVDTILFPTDEFMRYSRKDRCSVRERYLDHPNWYDLEKLVDTLNCLLNGSHVHLDHLYNHANGELDSQRDIDYLGNSIIVIEGMYALHTLFSNFLSFSILLYANHDDLLARVIKRDSEERNISENSVRERYWIINGNPYQSFYQSAFERASLTIDNSDMNNIKIIRANLPNLILPEYSAYSLLKRNKK